MKIFKKNLKGGNSHKAVRTTSLFVLTLVFALVLCSVVSAGTPLQVNQTGTVSGDLYVNTTDGWPSSTQGATNEVTQANTLPAYTSIDSAMVYVNVYSGSGSNNWPVRTTIKLDGNGDRDYDDAGELLGVEDMNIPGSPDGTVYWLNDHCNRVYSDYQVWYDVKNLITSNNPTLYVKTETMGGDGYDGRIKLLALCVAYNDGGTDKVDYWVLNGQDWINTATSPSTSTFNTSNISGQVSNAILNTVALSGTDGNYTFNGSTKTGNITETGTYYKENSWDVTNDITACANSTLTYANVGSSLKLNLATLTIRESAIPAADFTATKTSGKTPLTVTFTDNSTNATGWLWDFGDGNTSTDQNPTHTYSTLGSYTVKLTVTNNVGSNTATKTGYITVTPATGINWTTKTAWNTPDVGSWACPCLADLDGDGDYDLLISAADGITYGYENTGTASNPIWTAKTAWKTPDVGSGAAVCCADLDGDGDYDLLIGTTGGSGGVMVAIENIGTTSSPIWATKSEWNINVGSFTKACCVDLDGDGDYDLLIGDSSHVLRGFENTGNVNVPVWTAKTAWNLSGLGSLVKPCCADLDGDGDYDLLISAADGITYGYENTGTINNPVWTANSLLNIPTIGSRAASCFADLDGDGDYDLLIGENGGVCYGYENSGVLVLSPDLTPTAVTPVTLTVNKIWNITATVRNTSSVNVGAFVATLSVDGVVVDTQSVLGLNASSNSTVNFSWTPTTAGTYNLIVTVDPSDRINETNETNNTLIVPVAVVVDTQAPTVNATPIGGNLASATQVTLSAIDDYDTNPKIYYTTDGSDPITSSTLYASPISISKTTALKFIAIDFSGNISPVQTETYTDSEAPTTVANPTGGNSISAVNVTLSATDNVTSNPIIYYTNNGTNPTTTSTRYTSPLTITATTTLKFIAADDSGNISPVQSETYTINDTEAPIVTVSPAGGTYTSKTDVTLSVSDNVDINPVIYLTLDGIDPTTNSTVYTAPLTFTSNTILKFIARDATGNTSPVQTESYIIHDTEAPVVNASLSGTTVTLSDTDNADPHPVIYYTSDGTDPITSSTPYSGPFTIPRAAITVVKFIAVDASGNTSPVQSETYNTTYTTDLLTRYYAEGHVGVIVDNGGTGYYGGDPAYNLSLPAGATILAAHLYIAWNWYGYFPSTVSFNGHTFTGPTVHYADGNDGQDMFDVTQYFNMTGTNTAHIINGNSAGVYGRTLIVVYQSDSEPYRKIWVNEGYDIIPVYSGYGATEGPGYSFFNNVTNNNLISAQIIITLPSGDNDSPSILLNGQTFTITNTGGSDPSFKYYNITPTALQNGFNTLEVPNMGYMSISNAILTLTLDTTAPTVTADPTSKVFNTSQIVTLTATDNMDTSPDIYCTLNGDTPTISSTLYSGPITLTDTTTLKFFAVDDAGNSSNVQSETYTIELAPVADFTATPTTGTTPLKVAFTNQSTGNITSYAWDFNNDGNTESTDTSPTWTYNTAGTYTVKLTVTGPGGSDDEVKTDYITVNEPAPVAQFTATPTTGTTPLQVTFTNTSTGNVTTYAWDFDNNGTTDSTETNPTWTYSTVGTYAVKLTVTGPGGSDDEVKTDYITVNEPAPVAQFVGTPNTGTTPLQVVFTNQSSGSVTSYQWDFDNNGTTDSTETNPTWTYNTPGTYTVKLTVTGPGGSDDEIKTNYITVIEPVPEANFVGISTSGSSPLAVAFTDQSTNATSYAWDFNDDGTVDSTDQNPTWTYDHPGNYTVRLTVTGPGGTDEETKTDYITVNKSAKSDLLATEMKVTNSPYLNYSLVEVTITNIGLKTAGYFDVTLYDNGTQVKQQYALWLGSDAVRTLSFIWSPATIGEHHLEAVIDQNNNIQESNENNNQITQLVDNRPDLTPTGLKAKKLPLNYCYVTVDVTNNGEDLTEFYDVTLYDNGAQVGQQKVYGLRTGETKTVTFLCKLTTSSTHNLQATTDATSTIPETNETNNTLAKQL